MGIPVKPMIQRTAATMVIPVQQLPLELEQPPVFLSKAKELDVNQGCVSRSESQVKIQRILNSRF